MLRFQSRRWCRVACTMVMVIVSLGVGQVVCAGEKSSQVMETPSTKLEGTLVFTCAGGDQERAFTQFIGPMFQKKYGTQLLFIPGTSSDIMAKLIAQKDKPQIDVALFNQQTYVQGRRLKLLEPMNPAVWTTRGELYDTAIRDGEFGISWFTAWGLLYDKEMLKKRGMTVPPTSWLDLFDPKVADCVALWGFSGSSFPVQLLVVNEALGATEDNVDSAFKKFEELGAKLRNFPASPGLMNDIFEQRAACFAVNANSVSGPLIKREWPRLGWSCPKEGCMGQWTGFLPVRNAPHPRAAQMFANFVLTKEVQEILMRELPGTSPTNRNVKIPNQLREDFNVLNGSELRTLRDADWNKVANNVNRWMDRWQREVQK